MDVLVCHTPGCPNEGLRVEYDLTDPDNPGAAMLAICGPCGKPITDVTPGEPV